MSSKRPKSKISVADLRAGRWTIHPDILAGGNRLPRLADGKGYVDEKGNPIPDPSKPSNDARSPRR